MLVFDLELLFPILLHCPQGHLLTCFLPDGLLHFRVVDGAVSAVGAEDRGTDISADLYCAECRWSACHLLVFQ